MNKVLFVIVALLSVTSVYRGLLAYESESFKIKENDSFCINHTHKKFYSVLSVGVGSSVVFGLIDILPALFIRSDLDEERFKNSTIFKLLLAFAAGNLLADIFLHLLPEVTLGKNTNEQSINGLYIILSFLSFLTIEKVTELVPGTHALGALNLLANFFDNSAHGTTVVGAFQISITFGLIALLATIVHEVPHEFSDFALLLKDGYSRQKAIFLQLVTALAGSIGATIAFAYSTTESCINEISYTTQNLYLEDSNTMNLTNHIDLNHHNHDHGHGSIMLPFTIGGFLYISLVGIIPEIIEEKDHKTSFLQLISLLMGVIFIYILTQIETYLPAYFIN